MVPFFRLIRVIRFDRDVQQTRTMNIFKNVSSKFLCLPNQCEISHLVFISQT